MVFQISGTKEDRIEKIYEESMKDLGKFFELNWNRNRPSVFLIPDRKTIDSLKGNNTEDWVVGWSNGNDVFILSPKNYESESSHKYSDKEYYALLKHELAHCFSNIIGNYSQKPIWLLEGISIFLSGQNNFKNKPKKYSSFINYYGVGGEGVYHESGFAVEFLVKKYGK